MNQPEPANLTHSQPLFPLKTEALVSKLQKLSQNKLTQTLEVSQKLGQLNYDRYQQWEETPKRAALWMYAGDVYNGIDAYSMSKDQVVYAQQNLLIVSGLYGLVRPLDAIAPYRLEMRLPFAAGKTKDLYDYWEEEAKSYFSALNEPVILLCASQEYAKLIERSVPKDTKTIRPRFMQKNGTSYREKGLFAKYARGALARWVIDNKITSPKQLQKYRQDGFSYSSELSSESEIVYIVPQNFSLKGRFTKK